MQRANKGRAQDRLLLKQSWCLRQNSTTNCAVWSCEPPGVRKRAGYVSEQWLSDQGSLPNKYETSRYPKATSTSRRGSSAMIITEMTKMSGRGFGDLCSVINEWSRGQKTRGVNIRSRFLVKHWEGGIARKRRSGAAIQHRGSYLAISMGIQAVGGTPVACFSSAFCCVWTAKQARFFAHVPG